MTLAQARKRRDKARAQLADNLDPSLIKRAEKQAKQAASASTFEKVAQAWLTSTAADRKAITQNKMENWLKKDIYPSLGKMPIASIGPRDVLAMARKMEARGAYDSTKRLVQICGQVFRFAVAEGSAEHDVTVGGCG